MTFSRARTGHERSRRARRNRKRPESLWRRASELGHAMGRIPGLAKRGLPVIAALMGAALAMIGGYVGYRFIVGSSHFAVHTIDVRGAHRLDADEIAAVLGVSEGDNIFRVEIASMVRALEAEPWIARATVRRELPSTLVVEIEEKEPAAVVDLGGLYLADAEGRVFARAATERGDGAGLPVITGLSRADHAESPEATAAAIRDALEAVAVYQTQGQTEGALAGERPRLGEVHVHPREGLTLLTYERAVAIRVGRGDVATLRERLRAFDLTWQALSSDERLRARIVYADNSTRPDRVTIGLSDIE